MRPRTLSSLAAIVMMALALRVVAFASLPHKNVWTSAAEIAEVAKSLATGQGFSSPFGKPTGATAWVAPAYPLLLAAIFKVFGVFSRASALLTFMFQIVVSSLTCVPILKLGEELGSPRVGKWAAWCWACYPYLVLVPVLFIWETAVSALLLGLLLLVTAQLRRDGPVGRWALYGSLWALAALANPALLSLIPVCAGWLWWEKRRMPLANVLAGAAVSFFVFLLLISPWCWRNWKELHAFVPLRSSFGEALWLGNHPGGRGRHTYGDNAYENAHELERYQTRGEIAYARGRKNAALVYIESAPWRFLRNVGYRAAYWWFAIGEGAPIFLLYAGLGLASLAGMVLVFRAGEGGWYLVSLSVLVFPLTYYLTDVMARYRHPVEPAMVLTAAYAAEWITRKHTAYQAAK